MDADTAVTRINVELLHHGLPPLALTEPQRQQAFRSLKAYAAAAGRPLEVAVKDLVRFQKQTLHIEQMRSQP